MFYICLFILIVIVRRYDLYMLAYINPHTIKISNFQICVEVKGQSFLPGRHSFYLNMYLQIRLEKFNVPNSKQSKIFNT